MQGEFKVVCEVDIYIYFVCRLLVCEQVLKGIVYPQAVKAPNVLDPVYQNECITLLRN